MNIGELAENLGMEEEECLELVELFIETGMSDLDKLQSAIAEKDTEGAAIAAHSLKGASGNLGFTELYEIAKSIEGNTRNGQLDGAAEATQALKEKLNIIAGNKD